MKLEQQVISLSLAKRLKELGVKQESYFKWAQLVTDKLTQRSVKIIPTDQWAILVGVGLAKNYAAFTIAELGEMLPWEYATLKHLSGKYVGVRTRIGNTPELLLSERSKEAEQRGLMLAYLIENKLLTPNEEV